MKKYSIGIDIGGTRTKIGLVDIQEGRVVRTIISATETKSGDAFLTGIQLAVDEFKTITAAENATILGIGFGIPGFVFQDGMVDSTYGFLEFMEDYPLKSLIEDAYQIPCRLDNDARVVALGEALYGAGKSYNRVLVLTLGTGLGVGFTVAGKLNEPLPYAHMAGHISIAKNDVVCYCGKTGCLEAMVSATGLCDAAEKAGWKSEMGVTAERIFAARAASDIQAGALVDEFMANLSTGIDNYVNIYAPDIIILGGGVAKGLVNDLDKLHNPALLNPYKKYKTILATSKLEEEAGILGSAALFNQTHHIL